VDHVVYLQDDDVAALADSETVAVLLPATTLFLGSDTYAPARRLIDAGVRVALGTDFNPGTSYTQSMQLVLSLAVLKLKMTPEEAIQAATIHAAAAVGMQDRIGSLEVGKFCDLSVFTVEDYRAIPYHLGANLVDAVVAGGEVVVQDGRAVRLTSAHPA
jgi:imidazolonepropionase